MRVLQDIVVLGASGRVGRLLARAAAPEGGFVAAPRDGPLPQGGCLLNLAGVTPTSRDPKALALNRDLALAAVTRARAAGIGRVFMASSAAVYGEGGPHAEEGPTCPLNAYGRAKLEMERAVAGMAGVHVLRIGNVAGADQLLLNAAKGPVVLDRFADGQGPRRSYIGPQTLWRVIRALAAAPSLPPVLNLAAPGLVAMSDLLEAAGVVWSWRPAPQGADPEVALALGRLAEHVSLPPETGSAQRIWDEVEACR